MTLPAGTQIGKYVVRRKLAEGGMAEIYLCTSQGAEGFEKEVVIKRIRSFLASDPGFVEMFIAEAMLASRLNHANVVQIFDFEKHEDTYYLAMEYVRGCALSELRKKCKELMEPMPPVLVAHIGAEVARGLHYAHRLKVNEVPLLLVHRDVTPQNVLISFDGAVKLTDFGIARSGNKLTSPGMLKGKFAYMSPEQSRGENVDARTDVFALGIVLWEMLTGGRLFDGDSELAVLRAVQQSVIPHPARLNPDVPEDLDAVVMKALERGLEERYQTAGELERALAQCVLNHARSPDDTDVAGFVRRVYLNGQPSRMALPAMPERTQRTGGGAARPEPEPVPREPTAVLPGPRGRRGSTAGGGGSSRPELSPDEDVHASTHLLARREESASGKSPLPARVATPGRPLPAVRPSSPGLPPSEAPGGLEEDSDLRPTEAALPAVRTHSRSVPAVGTHSRSMPALAPTAEGPQEPPRYESTVALPTPAPTPAPRREPAASPRRLGLWAGLGLLAVLAMVGVESLARSRAPAPQPPAVAGEAPPAAGPGAPVAASPSQAPEKAAEAPAVAAPTEPAPPAQGQAAAPPEAEKEREPEPLAAAPLPVEPVPEAPEKPRAALGTLTVIATPYATVRVNGRQLGEVQGRKSFRLAPGRYELSFEHPRGSKSEPIVIEPDGTVRREFRVR